MSITAHFPKKLVISRYDTFHSTAFVMVEADYEIIEPKLINTHTNDTTWLEVNNSFLEINIVPKKSGFIKYLLSAKYVGIDFDTITTTRDIEFFVK